MDDIVERLRTIIATPHGVDIWTTTALEAADEIEQLRAIIDDLLPVWEPCRYDHDGYCQAHYLHERPCPVQSLKELRNG